MDGFYKAAFLSACAVTAAAAAGPNITVDRSSNLVTSQLTLGITHTQIGVDQFVGQYAADPAAAARAKALLTGVSQVQNINFYNWGSKSPLSTEGQAGSPYDPTVIDGRENALASIGGMMSLTLCTAPNWMKDRPTDTGYDVDLPVTPAHFENYADLAVAALRHARDVTHKPFSSVQVWSEMRGFWNSAQNRYDVEGYTQFYNTVYDAIKAFDPTLQVGGPYYPVYDNGTSDALNATDTKNLTYFLKNMHGADFLSVDHGTVDANDTTAYTDDQRIQLASRWGHVMTGIRSELAANGKAALPIHMSEYYGLERGGTGTPQQVAAMEGLIYKYMAEGGVAQGLLWNGGEGESNHALYTDIRNAGGGVALPHYQVFKDAENLFGQGTTLTKVTTDQPTVVDALASSKFAMVINKTGSAVTTNVNGRSITLGAYEVRRTTLLPVPSMSFNADATFDTNFKQVKAVGSGGIYRDTSTNRLRVGQGDVGMAVLDMKAAGGNGGHGGVLTGDYNANDDLDNFSVMSRVETTTLGNTSQAGYLMRLDDNESNGYLALASWDSAAGVRFRLFRGASETDVGSQVFSLTPAFAGTLSTSTDYFYRVSVQGSAFTFQWMNDAGAMLAQATYTDGGTGLPTTGEAGIRLRAAGAATYMDQIAFGLPSATPPTFATSLPEPASCAIFGVAVAVLTTRNRKFKTVSNVTNRDKRKNFV